MCVDEAHVATTADEVDGTVDVTILIVRLHVVVRAVVGIKLIIYGEVTDPSVTIAGHIYSVTGHVDADEYLVIDSRTKTITKVESDGDRVNWFQYRNKLNYVFQKIPSGENNVLWDGTFSFNVTLYEERSEPKWI